MLQEMKENLFEGLKAGAYTASTSGDMTLHVFLGQLNYNFNDTTPREFIAPLHFIVVNYYLTLSSLTNTFTPFSNARILSPQLDSARPSRSLCRNTKLEHGKLAGPVFPRV